MIRHLWSYSWRMVVTMVCQGAWTRSILVGCLLTFTLGAVGGVMFFSMLADPRLGSDLPLHIQLVLNRRFDEMSLNYTIYYTLLELVSGRGDAEALRRATVFVLAVSYGLRLAITWWLFSALEVKLGLRVLATLATALSTPLTVAPWAYYHIGKLSPVVWHNSTTVLAVPWALLLFVSTCFVMTSKTNDRKAQSAQVALILLSAAMKPNYVLALVPALAMLCCLSVLKAPTGSRHLAFRHVWRRAAPTGGAAIVVLVVQYLLTYGGTGLYIQGEQVTNVVAPFAVWQEWRARFGVEAVPSILLSVIPPAMLSIMVWRVERYRYPLALAWASVFVGLVQFTILAEAQGDGEVLFHGNWIWGAQISMAVLFIACIGAFAREFHALGRMKWLALLMVTYQVVMGLTWSTLFFIISR